MLGKGIAIGAALSPLPSFNLACAWRPVRRSTNVGGNLAALGVLTRLRSVWLRATRVTLHEDKVAALRAHGCVVLN